MKRNTLAAVSLLTFIFIVTTNGYGGEIILYYVYVALDAAKTLLS